MPPLSPFRPHYLLILTLLTLNSNPIFSLRYQNFDSDIALFGDAELINGGSSVQLTRSVSPSSGLLIQRKPIKFLRSNSLSTDFTFSISPQNGDCLALVIIPTNFPSKFSGKNSFRLSGEKQFLGIEFHGDEDGNHVGIDVNSPVSGRVHNVSSINVVLNGGVKLQSWVDYEASSKRVEIRVSKLGSPRPYNPLVTYPIDLSEMWKEEVVFVGLSSSKGNSQQSTSVYSWRFRIRNVPKSMHSQPFDPKSLSNERVEQKTKQRRSFCLSMFLSVILGFGCGGLTALVLLSLWVLYTDRNATTTAEVYVRPVDFRYEKVNVVVESSFEDVKK